MAPACHLWFRLAPSPSSLMRRDDVPVRLRRNNRAPAGPRSQAAIVAFAGLRGTAVAVTIGVSQGRLQIAFLAQARKSNLELK